MELDPTISGEASFAEGIGHGDSLPSLYLLQGSLDIILGYLPSESLDEEGGVVGIKAIEGVLLDIDRIIEHNFNGLITKEIVEIGVLFLIFLLLVDSPDLVLN